MNYALDFFFIETFQSFAHSSFETRRKSIH